MYVYTPSKIGILLPVVETLEPNIIIFSLHRRSSMEFPKTFRIKFLVTFIIVYLKDKLVGHGDFRFSTTLLTIYGIG